MPRYYPLFLNIEGKPCLVVGGGEVAERKVNSLLEHGARVHVVSPRLGRDLRCMAEKGLIRVDEREYREGDLDSALLVIAATDSPELNARVAREAESSGILVNVVDDPGRSTFIVPSLFCRGDVSIAISTSGKSPALARRIRLELERTFPEELDSLAALLSEVRQELKSSGVSVDKETWQDALDLEELLDMLRKGQSREARERIFQRLARPRSVMPRSEVDGCNS